MPRSLPPNPTLRYLQEQAKDLLKAQRKGDARACSTWRRLHQFTSSSDREILLAEVSLGEAQLALALDYGFSSWAELKEHIESPRRVPVQPTVQRDGGRVWISGVPILGWSGAGVPEGSRLIDGNCTFVGALTAALAATDRPFDYPPLLACSGLGHTLRWGRRNDGQGWDPEGPNGEFPEDVASLERVTGWRMDWVACGSGNEGWLASRVGQSVESGLGVLGRFGDWTMGLVYGYEDDGRTLLVRDYWRGAGLHRVGICNARCLVFLKGAEAALSPTEALVNGLSIAADNWRRSGIPGDKTRPGRSAGRMTYWYSQSAYQRWIADLAEADGLEEEARASLFRVNTWTCHRLYDSHLWTGRFLATEADRIGGVAAGHLRNAAELYERGRLLIIESLGRDAFFLAVGANATGVWTSAVRQREQQILGQLVQWDAEAAGCLEKALGVFDKSAGDMTCH